MHCGLCLQACPTYLETGRETSSPRGRVYLLRGVAEGRFAWSDAVTEEVYLCLDCRACETACPSGVRVGSLIELARAEVESAASRRGWRKQLEWFGLRRILPHRSRLHALMSLLATVQRLRLDRAVAAALPRRLRDLMELLPRVPAAAERAALPEFVPAEGERRGRVAFFVGCVMPELFGAVNAATVRVLARNGFDVVIPPRQGCCGALHLHTGDRDFACELVRANTLAFDAAAVDAIVVNSAGCGAAMREAADWLGEAAEAFSGCVCDVSEFLDRQGLREPDGRIEATVCYDDPCHLVHGQGVADAPRRLLARIPGLTLAAHDDPESCCGAAGIYNITHPEMSRAVLDRKLAALAAAAPDIITSGNPGCLMQLESGARRSGLAARVVHPIVLLDEAYL
ncbi:MAG: 4Fe-4S dicluster domain-containing protein [Deltaproteobacteria bacterium]|nr:4Fe-4S dicluster domain-containing protein [Deltaproteobacteria bacterium]